VAAADDGCGDADGEGDESWNPGAEKMSFGRGQWQKQADCAYVYAPLFTT